jgi:hypothetical protein
VGSKTRHTTKSFANTTVESANIASNAVTSTKISDNAVTSAKINNATITVDDLASTLDLSSKTLTLPSSTISFDSENYNIGLLGFKMAVNESLTVFNLIDGVVDEFNDESGTDEAEGTNDNYCGTDDLYSNQCVSPASFSAGFTTTSITEPDTSTAGTNPAYGCGSFGSFTVPDSMTSLIAYTFGAAGGGGDFPRPYTNAGGGGGYATGTLAVTPGQSIKIVVGEGGGSEGATPTTNSLGGGGVSGPGQGGDGGGLSGLFSDGELADWTRCGHGVSAPQVLLIAGAGGGAQDPVEGGAGGGTTGQTGTAGTGPQQDTHATQTSSFGNTPCSANIGGGGGGQSSGGSGGQGAAPQATGGLLFGGDVAPGGSGTSPQYAGGGGAGYYGGGAGSRPSGGHGSGGGGSSYIGNPQISSGSTEGGDQNAGGGTASPVYVPGTNEGLPSANAAGEDGYVLLTGCGTVTTTASTTIVSASFTSTTVPTTSRIVVFEENIDTPTLNTDIIASVSRDGTNFTNATLSDSGYVTGSSGQRILTGQVDISGQPSGQSMRWKLQLANNQVKIHGVSLSWA